MEFKNCEETEEESSEDRTGADSHGNGNEAPAAVPTRPVPIREQNLLEIPLDRAAKNMFPPGCSVLHIDESTWPSTNICTVGAIFFDLESRQDVYRLRTKDKEIFYARKEELQFGVSCPVWARPITFTDTEGDLPAVIVGSYEQPGRGHFFSVRRADSETVKYHGIPACSIRYRFEEVGSVLDPKKDKDLPDKKHKNPLDHEEIHIPQSKRAKTTDTDGVVSESEDTPLKLQPESSTSRGLPLSTAELLASSAMVAPSPQASVTPSPQPSEPGCVETRVPNVDSVTRTLYVPCNNDADWVSATLIGEGARLQEKFQCEIVLQDGFSPSNAPPMTNKIFVTGGSKRAVLACIEYIEELLVMSALPVDRGHLLYQFAKMNNCKKKGTSYFQRCPTEMSKKVWMCALDLPEHADAFMQFFVERDSKGLRKIEARTSCQLQVAHGNAHYILVTANNAQFCNHGVRQAVSKLQWAERTWRERGAAGTLIKKRG